jgi:basic membrane protein A
MTPAQVQESWKLFTTWPAGVPLPLYAPYNYTGSVALTPVPAPTGNVTIAIATVGDSHDQGFYQSYIDKARAFAQRYGWKLIVDDRVNPSNALQIVEDLCSQGANFIALGDSQMAGGLPAFKTPECAHAARYIDGSGTSIPTLPSYSQGEDFVNETLYAAGIASGLEMKRYGWTKAGFITGPQLDFSTAAAKAWAVGIKQIVPNATVVKTFTGDFDDPAKGQAAAQAQIQQGVKIMYPYLGGATNATVKVANAAGVETLTPGNYRCNDTTYKFGISVLFDPGYYLLPFLQAYHDGTFKLGQTIQYHLGRSADPNIVLCNGTPAEETTLAQTISGIGSGAINSNKIVGDNTND